MVKEAVVTTRRWCLKGSVLVTAFVLLFDYIINSLESDFRLRKVTEIKVEVWKRLIRSIRNTVFNAEGIVDLFGIGGID